MIEQARQWLKAAKRVAVMTGAGVSAESGIPTFRGAGGLWKEHKAEALATPEAFARDPKLVWEWYQWRRSLIAAAQPNAAHRAIARLHTEWPDVTLITQNVDSLHDRAGSWRSLKLHGDIWRFKCTACGAEWPDRRVALPKLPPHCQCGGVARPGVVWFGEPLPAGILKEAEHAASRAEVMLVVGTSAVVYPAASLIPYAKRGGAKLIEVNIEDTAMSNAADAVLRGPAAEIMPALVGSTAV